MSTQPGTQKILTELFITLLLLFFLPASASAAAGAIHPVSDPAGLTVALNASGNGDTIKLLCNIEYNTGITIEGKYITFDLNGCTLNVTNTSGTGLTVGSGGNVNLTGEGEFNVTGTNYGVNINSGGQATVDNASVNGTDAVSCRSVIASGSGSFITIRGNAISTGALSVGVLADSGATVIVDGNVNGVRFGALVFGYESSLRVGGDITASKDGGYGVWANSGGRITVDGDVIATGNSGLGIIAQQDGTVTVTGNVKAGVSSGCGADVSFGGTVRIDGSITSSSYVNVQETYKVAADGIAGTGDNEDYFIYSNGTSSVIVKGLCKIADKGVYMTLDDALDAAIDGDTLQLLKNVEYNKGISVVGKRINLNTNGFILNVVNTLGTGLEVCSGGEFIHTGGGALNITGTSYGVYSHDGGGAAVTNAAASGIGGTGVYVHDGGVVNVEGKINASNYTNIQGVVKTASEGVAGTGDYTNYFVYVVDTSVVRVKGLCIIIGKSVHATLDAALDAAIDGDTILLLTNIDYNSGLSISEKSISFDLNGFTLDVINSMGTGLEIGSGGTVSLTGVGDFNVTGSCYGVYAHDGGKATVTNALATEAAGFGTYAVNGGIIMVAIDVRGMKYGVRAEGSGSYIEVGGNAIATGIGGIGASANDGRISVNSGVRGTLLGVEAVNGGEVEIGGNITTIGEIGLAAYGVYAAGPGSFITTGGDITVAGAAAGPASYGVYVSGAGNYITVGGNIITSGASGIGASCADGGAAVISGNIVAGGTGVQALNDGTVTVGGDVQGIDYGAYVNGSGSSIVVSGNVVGTNCGVNSDGSGSSITAIGSITASGASGIGAWAQNGGMVNACNTVNAPVYVRMEGADKTVVDATVQIYNNQKFYIFNDDTTGSTVRIKVLCQIIGKGIYPTLDAALADVSSGDTIQLLGDLEYGTGIVVTGKTITFDLNGYTLSAKNASGPGLEVGSGGVVKMTGIGAFDVTGTTYGVYAYSGGKASVSNATATGVGGVGAYAYTTGVVTVNGNATSTGSSTDSGIRGYGGKAYIGGILVVNGDAIATGTYGQGIYAYMATATVGGNAVATGYEGTGAINFFSGTVTVMGDARGTSYGAASYGGASLVSKVIIGGNAVGTGSSGCSAIVDGDKATLSVSGNAQGVSYGAQATNGGTLTVGGNITATGLSYSMGLYVANGGLATVGGVISAPIYIYMQGIEISDADGIAGESPYTGYMIYSDGTSTVRVKIPVVPGIYQPQKPTDVIYSSDIDFNQNPVVVLLSDIRNKIDNSAFTQLVESNKTKPVVIQANDYQVTFPAGTMKELSSSDYFHFSVRVGGIVEEVADIILRHTYGGSENVIISFFNDGGLPTDDKAIISFKVGTGYAGIIFYYYYYNPVSDSLEYLQSADVDAEGWITVEQSHCSDYLLTSKKLSSNNVIIKEIPDKGNHTLVPYYAEGDRETIAEFSAIIDGEMHFIGDKDREYLLKDNSISFIDTAGYWAEDEICFITARELFDGTGEGRFSPNDSMTRGMVATVLGRLWKIDTDSFTNARYTDVSKDAWYASYVEWASGNDIVKGIGNNIFEPDRAVTREELSVIMNNFFKFTGLTLNEINLDSMTFIDDAGISTWAKDSVAAMQKTGIIKGRDNGFFDPKGTATRAEFAVMLRRLIINIVQ